MLNKRMPRVEEVSLKFGDAEIVREYFVAAEQSRRFTFFVEHYTGEVAFVEQWGGA